MVTQVDGILLRGGSVPFAAFDAQTIQALAQALGAKLPEVGDLQWSERATKGAGWLGPCTGQAVSRTTYAGLFAVTGTRHGAGDGSTTFNLPDPQGVALIGAGTGSIKESFAAAAVTPGTDVIAVASNVDKWNTGMKVRIATTGTLPTPLLAATDYFVIRTSATAIKLATTLALAVAGTAIDITAAGTGTHTITYSLTARAIGAKGGEEMHASTVAETAEHGHPYTGPSMNGAGVTGGASNVREVQNSTTGLVGGSQAHNNMQPYLASNLFIYAGV